MKLLLVSLLSVFAFSASAQVQIDYFSPQEAKLEGGFRLIKGATGYHRHTFRGDFSDTSKNYFIFTTVRRGDEILAQHRDVMYRDKHVFNDHAVFRGPLHSGIIGLSYQHDLTKCGKTPDGWLDIASCEPVLDAPPMLVLRRDIQILP